MGRSFGFMMWSITQDEMRLPTAGHGSCTRDSHSDQGVDIGDQRRVNTKALGFEQSWF